MSILFYPISSGSHKCTPLPIETVKTKVLGVHSLDRAGLDVHDATFRVAECPVCKARYSYGDAVKSNERFIPYSELIK